ncbi:putative ATP-dependent RNA helicase DHX57 [Aulostomus maculatus]
MGFAGSDGVLEATGTEANLHANNIPLLSAVLCAALSPNVVQVQAPFPLSSGKMKDMRFMTKSDGCDNLHPPSVTSGRFLGLDSRQHWCTKRMI